MNVLVYSGPEVLQTSLSHSITSLRSLLFPNYAVQAITQQSLTSHPWSENCALLVFPACRSHLSASSICAPVKSYVENGGAILTIGARVRCQKSQAHPIGTIEDRVDRMRLDDRRSLRFASKSSGTTIDVTFGTTADDSPRVIAIKTVDEEHTTLVFHSGTLDLVDSLNPDILRSFARYSEHQEEGNAAVACCSAGKGQALFWGSLIDHPLTEEPALTIINKPTPLMSQEELNRAEDQRQELLRSSLRLLNLILPEQTSASTSPLPQFLTSIPSRPWIVDEILQKLSVANLESQTHALQDSNDTFEFHTVLDDWKVLEDARTKSSTKKDPSSWQPKHILVFRNSLIPPSSKTPLFNISRFYEELAAAHKAKSDDQAKSWRIGEALLYGEVVTSTQTMLDKNTHLLSHLPTPLLSLASHQLAGRGRGGNIWLSPSGCLQFSLLLRVSLAELPAARLVFVQYLFGLAVVEACRDSTVLGAEGKRVRLKWPNDIYAVRSDGVWKKIGGILVNTSFSSGKVEIVIGCGLNVWNPPPIQSLIQLVPTDSDIQLSMERTAAAIMVKFEGMWGTFLAHKGSFEPFMDLYYERWLHSDQLVELTTVTPFQKVRIVGITGDHGLLRTMPERDGWSGASGGSFIDLQPDGNSFDIMAGLIKAKS